MRNSSGQPATPTIFRRVPLGAGGQVIKGHIATDGTKVVCGDIHGAWYRGPSDTSWRYLFDNSGIPASIKSANHTRAGFPGGDYNDSSGCYDCVLAPSDSTVVFMIYDGQLIKSTDSGHNFAVTGAARSGFRSNGSDTKSWGHNITVDPNNPNIVLFGTNGNGVFYSTNGGTGFTSLSVSAGGTSAGGYATPHLTACDPTSTQVSSVRQTWFYTKYGTGIYRSTTGPGGTYSLLNTTGMPTNPTSLYVDNTGVLWVTQYGVLNNLWKWTAGGGWVNVIPAANQQITAVARDPADSNRILLHAAIGIYFLSRDGGTHWTANDSTSGYWTSDQNNDPIQQITRNTDIKYLDIAPPIQYVPITNQMFFDPTVAGRIWIAGWIDVDYCDLPSTGGGSATPLHWIGTGVGIEEAVVQTLCKPPGGKLHVGCWDLGTYRIDSLTRNVNPQVCAYKPGDTIANGLKHPTMVQHCVSIAYAADDPNWMVFMEHGGWDNTRIINPHVGFSTDGGQTLQPFPVDPTNKPYSNGGGSLAVGNTGNVIIIWNCNALPTYTKDGGNTWATLPLPGIINGDAGFEYQGGGGYFLNKHLITYDAAGGYFYLFNYGTAQTPNPLGIWRSTNGDSWTQMRTTAPTNNYVSSVQLKAVPGQAGHLFFTPGDGGGAGGFSDSPKRSSDGGVTWGSSLTTNSGQSIIQVSDFGFGKIAPGKSYPTIFFSGAVNGVYGIYRSDDNLVTSVLLDTNPAGSTDFCCTVAGDLDEYGTVYLGYSGSGVIYGKYNDTFSMTS